mmetsp:Transcript_2251/g.3584  ORF Transcript_2251/g.3584 Transcript_2251/m.3584 type:complete len:1376 (-) Transcript_2251:62-4189(-)
MFGGLAVKGGDAKDDSSSSAPPPAAPSSSGFSFLQTSTGTAAPTASSDQPAVEGEQQSSMSMGTSGGSAFGFLSGGSTTETNNNADNITNNNSAPPSMFAGLNNTPAVTNNSESQGGGIEAPPPQPSASGSGFSFMSSLATSAATPAESNNNSVEAASNVSTAGSSFGFMSSMMSTTDENGEQTEAGGTKEESSTAPASSGFSFLSSGSIGNTAPPPPADDIASHSPSLIPQSEPSSQGSSSMFAGLNTTATTETKNTENNNTATAPPPPPPADSDLLSMSSPALPAASGVSWGAPPGVGGGKKIVKKKRGKRVGVGVGSAADAVQQPQPPVQQQQQPMSTESSIPAPEPSLFQPPPPLSTDSYAQPAPSNNPPVPMYQPSPMASEIKTADEDLPPNMSPPMRVKAEMAMQNAEEFIKEKQRSAIAMAAERAMNEKVTSENGSGTGGGWKLQPLGAAEQHLSPKDSEYQAAKAAAEEARNLSSTKGKASLFSGSLVSGVSGFFGRKSPNTSSTDPASMASYSSHGGVVNNTLDPVRRTNSASSATSLSPTKEGGEQHQSTDPIQRENEEAKRAAAERDMAAFRESQMQEQERLAEAKRAEEKKQLEQERLRQLEEQAKRRSPTEKMQAALDHFADVTRTSTDYVTQLRAKRAELVKERMEAEKTERFAAQQISYAEAQQTQAAEDEDFEAADRLASDIERHTLEKNKQTAIVKSIAESISQIEKQRDAACKAVVACFSDVNSKLKELQADVDDREKQDGVLNQFANTSKRLSSETERLSNDLKHIERDESVLADEQKELECQITEQTKEFEEKRVEASEKLEVVNQEIEELRKKLAEAEEKAATLNNELSSYNGSIQSVRSKYSRQLGRLEKKERSVKESRAEWQGEHESVEKAKVAHESVVAAHSEEMLTREKIIEEIKVEVSVAHDFEDIVTSAFDATEFIGDGNQAFDGDVLKYEAAVDEANNNVISAESTIQSLQEELSTFDVRVPILEAEKKVAAAKRDFKAAGKASKEIKDALARKEQCEAELSGDAMERKQAAKEELQKVTLLLEEKKSIAAEKGKEASLKRIETLRERIAHLQSVVKELGVDPTDSDSINVACVGAFVIDSQISVLEAEGKALREKYGGWETDAVEDSSNAADEANGVGDVPSDTVIDDDTLQEYATLAAEIEELEAKIDQAAAEEDYDTATELEEKADSLRSKINSLGHSPEQMAQAIKDRATNSSENESPNNILDESILDKYASLRTQVEQLEADIETAVATDNFDDAAELEEKVQVAKAEIESLGFSVDDLEEALKNGLKIDEAEPDTEAIDETADDVAQAPSDDVDVIEEEANDTKENETPNGTDAINDEANENDVKVTQTASESDDAQVIED